MKAAYIHGKQNIIIKEVDKPQIDDTNNVLLKVLYCGICGSDMPKYFGNRVKQYPLVLGHELCGIVEEGPKNLIGKLVAVKPKFFCGQCENCKQDRLNLCVNIKTVGSDIDGGFQQYMTIPDKYLQEIDKLKDNPKLGALLEPFSVGVHACKFVRKNSHIAIVGNGVIGNMIRIGLKYKLGIDDVTVIGRDFPINTKLNFYDTIFECSGTVNGLNTAINVCKYKGDIIQIGIIYPEYVTSELEFDKILRKELSIKGSWDSNYTTEWDESYQIMVEHPQEFENMIGTIFTLDDINNAFNYKKMSSSKMKVLIRCNDE